MQAIVTKYFGPGNVRGSRIKATASAGSVTIEWDSSLNADKNHCAAARALTLKFGWDYGTWHCGGMPNSNDRVWVCPDRHEIVGADCFATNSAEAA